MTEFLSVGGWLFPLTDFHSSGTGGWLFPWISTVLARDFLLIPLLKKSSGAGDIVAYHTNLKFDTSTPKEKWLKWLKHKHKKTILNNLDKMKLPHLICSVGVARRISEPRVHTGIDCKASLAQACPPERGLYTQLCSTSAGVGHSARSWSLHCKKSGCIWLSTHLPKAHTNG